MIPNQWYAILESNEVKKGKAIGVTRMGDKLVAWRDSAGKLTIMSDKCPHRGAAFSIGEVRADCIQCPFHGFEFDTSGACTFVPANGKNSQPPKRLNVHTYPTAEAHGLIYIWWGENREIYPALPYFDNIDEGFVYSTLRDHWNTHYSRAIENQLDVVHLPFVHHNTIGAGGQTLVHGPVSRIRETSPGSWLLEAWVSNERDMGQKPRKASEMSEPGRHPSLQFHFPNVWQLWISNEFRVFVAFAPIDDENTMLYVRQYHRMRAPVVRQVTNFFGNIGNLVIIRQDKRVVVTQRPKRSDLDIGEVLIPGDGPIIAYRKTRRALMTEKE